GRQQHVAHAAHRSCSPVTVDVERKEMIREIVTVRHPSEHGSHPSGGFPFIHSASGRCALHASAARIAISTAGGSIPETTFTWPIRSGKTKCTFPWTVF